MALSLDTVPASPPDACVTDHPLSRDSLDEPRIGVDNSDFLDWPEAQMWPARVVAAAAVLAISRKISWNICRGMATLAIWRRHGGVGFRSFHAPLGIDPDLCREGGTTIVFPLAIALNFNKIAATPALAA
jgi:hypothetical protein